MSYRFADSLRKGSGRNVYTHAHAHTHTHTHTHTQGLGQSRKIISVFCENHSDHIIIFCSENSHILVFSWRYIQALKGFLHLFIQQKWVYIYIYRVRQKMYTHFNERKLYVVQSIVVNLQYISVKTTIWYMYLLQYNIYSYSSYMFRLLWVIFRH